MVINATRFALVQLRRKRALIQSQLQQIDTALGALGVLAKSGTGSPGSRRMSAAARARIAAAQKKRWAAWRKKR